jgi:hypothetical protein
MFHLVDHWLRTAPAAIERFDFAGSNDPGLARFYEGFGAERTTYFRLRRNTLPRWLRTLKP